MRRDAGPAALAGSVVAVAGVAASVVLTWLRLFFGMDLRDESFYVLIPWRWALGDKPFVQEQNLAQIPGLLTYPFVKAFGVFRHYDPTGLILYTRHLYVFMMIGVAAAVFCLLRRLVRWQLALLISAVCVTYIFWATPQLSYNTIALAFLTLGEVLGAWVVVEGRGRRYALASGMAFGVAVAAYPSLLFVMPFCAVIFVFAQGRRAVAMIAHGAFADVSDPDGAPTGPAAWRSLSAWVLGGALVVVPMGLLMLSFGPRNLARCWQYTMAGARTWQQLGGTSKAVGVVRSLWGFWTWRPYLIVAAMLIYLVYRRWPRAGRALLVAMPVALWLAAQMPLLWNSGFVLLYSLAAPYLYLFVPQRRRSSGAKLLIWLWAPAVISGAMTAYTSAAGYVNAAPGLASSMVLSGLFLAWALEASVEPSTSAGEVLASGDQPGATAAGVVPDVPCSTSFPWLALLSLLAVVAATVSFQFQFQQRDVAYGRLTSRFTSGPWWGIEVTPERRRLMDGYAADLRSQAHPEDKLLVIYEGSGYYLYWNGEIAANSYWISADPETGDLPQATISYYRRHRVVPTLVVNLIASAGLTDAELQAACGGLDYPPILVRPMYAFHRKPAGETTAEVLARLPRE